MSLTTTGAGSAAWGVGNDWDGSALVIEGNVAGGIVLAVPPKDNNPNNADEDGDGIEDAKEGSAQVVTYGAAPAMVIGATNRDIAIGAVAGTATQYGLQIDGSILGSGSRTGRCSFHAGAR